MQHRLPHKSDLAEIPRAQHRPLAQSLIHYEQQFPTRDAAIAAAYASGGFTMKAIGEHFGLHYSRMSRITQQQEEAKDKTCPFLSQC